ncbi:MAG: phosphotransferase [Pseudomonadota bacterium]
MTFPRQPEQLTSAWLSAAYGQAVHNFRVELFGEGAGIIGQVTRVHLETDNGPQTIIAKFASPAAENRAVAATYDMYGREVNFYQNVASLIRLRVPACYHAEIDTDSQEFVILMEDIQDMSIGDQVAGCTVAEAHRVVEGIARLHASSWATDLDLVSHNNPAQREGMMAGFGVGWPVVCAQFPEFLPANAAELGEKVPAAVGTLLEEMCTAPVSIVHADVRLDNVFFNDEEIALVDWQSVCTSAPEQDLAYFVTQSLSTEVRNAEDWVAVYHRALVTHGVSDYSLEACRQRYKVSALYLLCYATVIAGTLDLANERGQALGRTLFGNAMTSLQELDAFALLD